MSIKVGIIVVTYNSQNDIGRLMNSILTQECTNLVVYVVDNNSSDETLNVIQEYDSRLSVCVINSQMNNGYAKGNNIGIMKAMDDGCEFIFILNPDMQLERKCLQILVERISSGEKIGVVGPIVLFGQKNGNLIQNYGVLTNFKTQKKLAPYSNQKLTDKIPHENYADYVIGGAMMIKSDLLRITGLFEEDYFMYNDEIDLAYRIKKAEFLTICTRNAIVRHHHDFNNENKSGNNLMYYYIMRNRYLYFRKFHLYFNLSLSLIIEFLKIPLTYRWAITKMGGIKFLKYYYSGLWDGLSNKKGIANKSF